MDRDKDILKGKAKATCTTKSKQGIHSKVVSMDRPVFSHPQESRESSWVMGDFGRQMPSLWTSFPSSFFLQFHMTSMVWDFPQVSWGQLSDRWYFHFVHTTHKNCNLALQPMKRACLLELFWVKHIVSTPISSWYPAQHFSMVPCPAHCQDTTGRLAADVHIPPAPRLCIFHQWETSCVH